MDIPNEVGAVIQVGLYLFVVFVAPVLAVLAVIGVALFWNKVLGAAAPVREGLTDRRRRHGPRPAPPAAP
jgi:hypothetical protein